MKLTQVLVEYQTDITAVNLADKLVHAAKADPSIGNLPDDDTVNVAKIILHRLEKADPTKNKKYSEWIARTYAKGGFQYEDVISVVADGLSKFDRLKHRHLISGEQADIGRYHSFDQFEDFIINVEEPEAKKPQDRGNYEVVYDGPEARVIWPKDETAAKFWGQGTRWCTAAEHNNYFDTYNNNSFLKSGLRIMIPKNPEYPGEKYQYYLENWKGYWPKDRDQESLFHLVVANDHESRENRNFAKDDKNNFQEKFDRPILKSLESVFDETEIDPDRFASRYYSTRYPSDNKFNDLTESSIVNEAVTNQIFSSIDLSSESYSTIAQANQQIQSEVNELLKSINEKLRQDIQNYFIYVGRQLGSGEQFDSTNNSITYGRNLDEVWDKNEPGPVGYGNNIRYSSRKERNTHFLELGRIYKWAMDQLKENSIVLDLSKFTGDQVHITLVQNQSYSSKGSYDNTKNFDSLKTAYETPTNQQIPGTNMGGLGAIDSGISSGGKSILEIPPLEISNNQMNVGSVKTAEGIMYWIKIDSPVVNYFRKVTQAIAKGIDHSTGWKPHIYIGKMYNPRSYFSPYEQIVADIKANTVNLPRLPNSGEVIGAIRSPKVKERVWKAIQQKYNLDPNVTDAEKNQYIERYYLQGSSNEIPMGLVSIGKQRIDQPYQLTPEQTNQVIDGIRKLTRKNLFANITPQVSAILQRVISEMNDLSFDKLAISDSMGTSTDHFDQKSSPLKGPEETKMFNIIRKGKNIIKTDASGNPVPIFNPRDGTPIIDRNTGQPKYQMMKGEDKNVAQITGAKSAEEALAKFQKDNPDLDISEFNAALAGIDQAGTKKQADKYYSTSISDLLNTKYSNNLNKKKSINIKINDFTHRGQKIPTTFANAGVIDDNSKYALEYLPQESLGKPLWLPKFVNLNDKEVQVKKQKVDSSEYGKPTSLYGYKIAIPGTNLIFDFYRGWITDPDAQNTNVVSEYNERIDDGKKYYIAFKLDSASRQKLRSLFPGKYSQKICSHITLAFNVDPRTLAAYEKYWGDSSFRVTGYTDSGKGVDYFTVESNGVTKRPDGEYLHITDSLEPPHRAEESKIYIRQAQGVPEEKITPITLGGKLVVKSYSDKITEKYLGPTTKVKINKQGWQKPLDTDFFGA